MQRESALPLCSATREGLGCGLGLEALPSHCSYAPSCQTWREVIEEPAHGYQIEGKNGGGG